MTSSGHNLVARKVDLSAKDAEDLAQLEAAQGQTSNKIVATCALLAQYGALPTSLANLVREHRQVSEVIVARVKKAALIKGIDLDDPANHGSWNLSKDRLTLYRDEDRAAEGDLQKTD